MDGPGAHVATTPPDADRHPTTREALDRVEGELTGVEDVLTRLDDGTYGVCERCGVRLDDEILADDPLARRCLDPCT